MFSSYRKNVLAITTAFLVITSINGSAAFAEDELVTRARQLREVAIQKRENEARQAMTEASRLSKFSLTRAAEYLKPILESIESDDQLPAEKRDSLARILKSQIKVYEKIFWSIFLFLFFIKNYDNFDISQYLHLKVFLNTVCIFSV